MTKRPEYISQTLESFRGSAWTPYDLRLAMLAQHVGVDGAGGDSGLGGKSTSQPRRIKEGAASDDLLLRQTGVLKRKVGQDVDGVRDE